MSVPGQKLFVGQPPGYVGRERKKLDDGRVALPASESPFECDANSDTGRRLVRLTKRDASLWPADRDTASACGVDFVPLELSGGEWIPARPDKPRASAKKD